MSQHIAQQKSCFSDRVINYLRPEISTPFYTLLKSKKGLNLERFRKISENILQIAIFCEKQKNVFLD
jgi:hypothetical protein